MSTRESLTWISPEQAREALQTGTGRGVKIAILDSGIDVTHPALANAKILDRVVVTEKNEDELSVDLDEESDVFGHGTAIAYLIHQLVPEAELGSFKVLQSREGQIGGKAALLQVAVDRAIELGYHIINCSFGTPARSVIFRYFKNWIDAAYLADVHIVTACNNANYARPEWPAHFPSVIAVNMGRMAESDELHYRSGHLVEFFARGERVRVPWLGHLWKTVTGSSYAAPCVAGLVARMIGEYPGLSAPFVKAMLREIASPWDPKIAGDNVWL